MQDLFLEGTRALGRLPLSHTRLLRDDWFDVVRTAENIRIKDGLIDNTIPQTLRKCGIEARSPNEKSAYHHLLMQLYLFGTEAKEQSRRRQGGRDDE